MEIPELAPNSHKYREAQQEETKPVRPDIQPVVTSEVRTRDKNPVKSFLNIFFSTNVRDLKDYLWKDLLIPKIKDLLFDLINEGSSMWIYHDDRKKSSGKSPYGTYTYTAYDGYSRKKDSKRPSRTDIIPRPTGSWDAKELIFGTKHEAEHVREMMMELISQYEFASVGDLYSFSNLPSMHTDLNYGWYDLRDSRVVRVRDGFLLEMPTPRPRE